MPAGSLIFDRSRSGAAAAGEAAGVSSSEESAKPATTQLNEA
jgi:hypothetical protein